MFEWNNCYDIEECGLDIIFVGFVKYLCMDFWVKMFDICGWDIVMDLYLILVVCGMFWMFLLDLLESCEMYDWFLYIGIVGVY